MFDIKKLPELVKDYLGGREFIDCSITNLTEPGDNYGSLILSVEINVQDRETNIQDVVKLVAKTPPPNEITQKVFNTKVTFKNEIEFYTSIWPAMQDLQEEHGMKVRNYVAKFAGGRFNLDGSEEVDDNAVLLLENLVVDGFEVLDRKVGFNLETTKLILRDLANFHATGIAYKLQKPEEFKTKVVPYLDGMNVNEKVDSENMLQIIIDRSVDLLQNNETTKTVGENARRLLENKRPRTEDSVFRTMLHSDLWVNNFMLKFNSNRNIVENKFVDFQVCKFLSPADDLIFFLSTSVQDDVIIDNFKTLIEYYHSELVDNLENLKCDTDLFSYKNFENELEEAKGDQFRHVLWMLFPICLEKSKAEKLKIGEGDSSMLQLNDRHIEKVFLLAECYKCMGWL